VVNEENRKGVPVINLFREGRGWERHVGIINFMNPEPLLLGSWLPTVVRDAGYTTAIAVLVVQRASWRIHRHHPEWLDDQPFRVRRVLTIVFGWPPLVRDDRTAVRLPLSICLRGIRGGVVRSRGQPGVNSLAAMYYPTYLRSTGIGASLGRAYRRHRGPLAAGALLGNGWRTGNYSTPPLFPRSSRRWRHIPWVGNAGAGRDRGSHRSDGPLIMTVAALLAPDAQNCCRGRSRREQHRVANGSCDTGIQDGAMKISSPWPSGA